MKRFILLVALLLLPGNIVLADTFGTGSNQFTIDFVDISGDASSANGTNISQFSSGEGGYKTFADPGDYRMGTYEITNGQWNKFTNINGIPTGEPSYAYDQSPSFTGTNVPTNYLSWHEGAQFVNYLNTSTGYQAAYKFTEAGNYAVWESGDVGYDVSNPFRNSNAKYFIPTEDEWIKAAYWNGTSLQTYATPGDLLPVEDIEANYDFESGALPWDVGSGSEELNGTFDMMGNVWEWMESPYSVGDYLAGSDRSTLGGSYDYKDDYLISSYRTNNNLFNESSYLGFRVAAVTPEPATMLLILGALPFLRKRNRK